jgi:hypothetical protein
LHSFLPQTVPSTDPPSLTEETKCTMYTRGAAFVSLLASGSAGEGQEQPFPLETWRRGVGSDHGSSSSRLAAKAVNSCLPWREPSEGASHLRGHEARTRTHQRADEQVSLHRQARSIAAALNTQLARWEFEFNFMAFATRPAPQPYTQELVRNEGGLSSKGQARGDGRFGSAAVQPARLLGRCSQPGRYYHWTRVTSEAKGTGGGKGRRQGGMEMEAGRHGGLEGSWSRGARLLEPRESSLEENSSACSGWADADH